MAGLRIFILTVLAVGLFLGLSHYVVWLDEQPTLGPSARCPGGEAAAGTDAALCALRRTLAVRPSLFGEAAQNRFLEIMGRVEWETLLSAVVAAVVAYYVSKLARQQSNNADAERRQQHQDRMLIERINLRRQALSDARYARSMLALTAAQVSYAAEQLELRALAVLAVAEDRKGGVGHIDYVVRENCKMVASLNINWDYQKDRILIDNIDDVIGMSERQAVAESHFDAIKEYCRRIAEIGIVEDYTNFEAVFEAAKNCAVQIRGAAGMVSALSKTLRSEQEAISAKIDRISAEFDAAYAEVDVVRRA